MIRGQLDNIATVQQNNEFKQKSEQETAMQKKGKSMNTNPSTPLITEQ